MSFIRYELCLAFKEPLQPQVQQRLDALENELRMLRKEAVVINEGAPNEEETRSVRRHICHHDAGEPCEEWEEIK